MHTPRAIKWFLTIGCFVMSSLLLIACSAHVVSEQTKVIPLGTTFLTTQSASSVFSVAWSSDGRRLALGYADGSVQVRNATTSKIDFTIRGHIGHVWAVSWSPDGKRLASASWDYTVHVSRPYRPGACRGLVAWRYTHCLGWQR